MTSQQILTADFLDLLFENRNKAYGAYTLRKNYDLQMLKAISISLSLVFILVLLINPSVKTTKVENDNGIVVITQHVVPPQPKKKQEVVLPQPSKATGAKQREFQSFKIVHKMDVPPVATQEELRIAVVSDVTRDGPELKPTIDPTPPRITGNGVAPFENKEPKVVAPDKQPQFPGGMQAWLNFLNNNLHSPQDLESGEKRTVNIRFHVDVDGTVTNFHVIQSGGVAFDNEVIRVLKKMPKWMPALQAGQPMAVSFTQPVTFVGMEE